MNPDETVLVNKLQKGDIQAFDTVFRCYYPALVKFASTYVNNLATAEDIVQEFFISLWNSRSKVQIKTSLKNYLFTAVKNACINWINREKKETYPLSKYTDFTEQNNPSEEGSDTDSAIVDKLYKAIEKLPLKRRVIFKLVCIEGLKYKEVADQLGVSVNTVKTQLRLALKTLRTQIFR